MYGFLDFGADLADLFSTDDNRIEPPYDDLISAFDQGLSEKEIKEKYKFDDLKDFDSISKTSMIGYGKQID